MTAVYGTPKGNLYGGPFDSSGLDPNVRATLIDYRWTTAFGGDTAATRRRPRPPSPFRSRRRIISSFRATRRSRRSPSSRR